MTVAPHPWLLHLRLDHTLRRTDVERRTRDSGGRVSMATSAQPERGTRPLSRRRTGQVSALRQVPGMTAEAWAAHRAPTQHGEDQP